jgi:hypothetical protein
VDATGKPLLRKRLRWPEVPRFFAALASRVVRTGVTFKFILNFPPEKIAETRPDYVLILPWNLKDEITAQLAYVRSWGAKFLVPIPEVSVI